MCSHYHAPSKDQLLSLFKEAPEEPYQHDLWPTYMGPFVRGRTEVSEDEGEFEVLTGQFGLLPSWVKDRKLGRRTYNARTETVASKPSFRSAWAKAQHCVIPASRIFEPDWRSGKAVATGIVRADGEPMAIAGLWEMWNTPEGRVLYSYTMLTVNADGHMMSAYHKPDDEKRMVVVLPWGAVRDWLTASVDQSMEFMRQYPSDRLKVDQAGIEQTTNQR